MSQRNGRRGEVLTALICEILTLEIRDGQSQ